jgi:hypothetical protein
MFDIDMEKELEEFDRDRRRFKNLKKLIDFKLEAEEFEGKDIKMNVPQYKKKLIRSNYIRPKNNDKGLF